MSHDYACGTNDTPLPAATVRRVVTVDDYRVQHDPEWDAYAQTGEDRYGDAIITRYGDTDRWVVRKDNGIGWLHRDALEWRKRNTSEPLIGVTDNLLDAHPRRSEIREMFHRAGFNSSRTDDFVAEHTFTLAEAFYVCGAEAP